METFSALALPPAVATALFWLAVVCSVVAQLFILRAVFRMLPASPVSPDVPAPRRWVEIVWVILPVGFLAAAFVGAWRAMTSLPL